MRLRDIKVGQGVYVPGFSLPRRRRWLRGVVTRRTARRGIGGPFAWVAKSGRPKGYAMPYEARELRPLEGGYPKGGKGR